MPSPDDIPALAPGGRRARFIFRGALLLLALIPSLLYSRPLLRGEIPLSMDTVMYFFPLRWHAGALLRGGELPLWNRCILGGMPLYSNPQAALAYPFHWPMLASPSAFSFLFPMTLQIGLWGALTAALLRRLGVSRAAALWGGALCVAGNHGWSRLQFGNFANVLPWMPLWLIAAHAWTARARGGARWLGVGAAAGAMMILSGAHQIAAYAAFAFGAYAAFMCAADRAEWRRWAGFFLAAWAWGIALGAPGWLPQLAFLRETSRGDGLDPAAALAGAFGSPLEILASLTGPWQGGIADAEASASLGAVAFAIAFAFPFDARLRRAWFGAWIMALACALVSWRPAMELILRIAPGAAIFHDPRRALGVSHWALVLAAGVALGDARPRLARRSVPARAALALAALAIAAVRTYQTTALESTPVAELVHPEGKPPLLSAARLERGERFFTLDCIRESSYEYRRSDLGHWAFPNLAMLHGWEDIGGYEPARSLRYDRWLASASAWPGARQPWAEHFGLVYPPPPGRFPGALGEANIRAALLPAWGLPVYLREMQKGVWAGLAPDRADAPDIRAVYLAEGEAMRELSIVSAATGEAKASFRFDAASRERGSQPPLPPTKLSEKFAVDAFAAPAGSLASSALAFRAGPAERVLGCFLWSAEESRLMNPMAAAGLAMACRIDPGRGWAEIAGAPPEDSRKLVSEIHANHLRIEIPAGAAGKLVIHDAYWSGWTARIGAEPAAVEPAPGGFWRSIKLPPSRGARVVAMSYWPPLLAASLAASLAGLVGVFVCWARTRGGD